LLKYFIIGFVVIVISVAAFAEGNTKIKSFQKAKKLLYKKIYNSPEFRKTIYCSCSYSKKRKIDFLSCGYKVRKNRKRAKRVEVEHVVPAHSFGQSFSEWRNGHPDCVSRKGKKYKGRKCAEKVNLTFKRMASDLYNLLYKASRKTGLIYPGGP